MCGLLQEQAERRSLKEQINNAAVCQLASRLNGDKSCSVEHPARSVSKSGTKTKYNARVRFRDGALILHGNNFQLSAVASDAFLVLDPRGPFPNSEAYYAAFANQHWDLIADRQLYAEYPVEAYLAYRFLKDSIAQLVPHGGGDALEQFFLKLVDDRNDNLLVGANLNTTGIMDWHMARVVPHREALGPSLITADASKPSRDQVSLSTDDTAMGSAMRERGVVDMLENLQRLPVMDEKVRRFFCGRAIQPIWADALPLAEAILKMFGVDMPWEEWKKAALEKYKDDKRLQDLIAHNTATAA